MRVDDASSEDVANAALAVIEQLDGTDPRLAYALALVIDRGLPDRVGPLPRIRILERIRSPEPARDNAGRPPGTRQHRDPVACETGMITPYFSGEVVSVAAAFVVAGASYVVAKQWPVDDACACLLLRRFYTVLTEAGSVARALRASQLWTRALTQAQA